MKPAKNQRMDIIESFNKLNFDLDITMVEINKSITERAIMLKSKHINLKLFDLIQISTAIETKCDIFLTNDLRLKAIDEINIQYLH
jgi:predicted nucleic acid-binding protein